MLDVSPVEQMELLGLSSELFGIILDSWELYLELLCKYIFVLAGRTSQDMRKGADTRTLTSEILWKLGTSGN